MDPQHAPLVVVSMLKTRISWESNVDFFCSKVHKSLCIIHYSVCRIFVDTLAIEFLGFHVVDNVY
jgi:hypothetical protein